MRQDWTSGQAKVMAGASVLGIITFLAAICGLLHWLKVI